MPCRRALPESMHDAYAHERSASPHRPTHLLASDVSVLVQPKHVRGGRHRKGTYVCHELGMREGGMITNNACHCEAWAVRFSLRTSLIVSQAGVMYVPLGAKE